MATAKQDKPANLVAVILRSASRPGLRACGDYLPDRIYSVDAEEAKRLVNVKGFEYSSNGDKTVANATPKEG